MERLKTSLGVLAVAISIAACAGGDHWSRSAGDARGHRPPYHTTGSVACSMGGGQPMDYCPFWVQRSGDGYGAAIVRIRKPDGQERSIYFRNGVASGYDMDGVEGQPKLRASKDGDLNIIRIGRERYDIPDALVSGW